LVMSVVDMDRIFEISVNKIEHSKTRKVYGKSTMLHRTLLVNTVINRVRNSDRSCVHKSEPSTSFTNYRDPKNIYDMDDYESDKSLPYTECQTRCKAKHINNNTIQKKRPSSLVTLLNSRALSGKTDELARTLCGQVVDEHVSHEKENQNKFVHPKVDTAQSSMRHEKRRLSCDIFDEANDCPAKKLRCIWPTNVSDVNNYSISGLASLFGDMVASNDTDKSSLTLNSQYSTAMVAC